METGRNGKAMSGRCACVPCAVLSCLRIAYCHWRFLFSLTLASLLVKRRRLCDYTYISSTFLSLLPSMFFYAQTCSRTDNTHLSPRKYQSPSFSWLPLSLVFFSFRTRNRRLSFRSAVNSVISSIIVKKGGAYTRKQYL